MKKVPINIRRNSNFTRTFQLPKDLTGVEIEFLLYAPGDSNFDEYKQDVAISDAPLGIFSVVIPSGITRLFYPEVLEYTIRSTDDNGVTYTTEYYGMVRMSGRRKL